MTSLWDILNLFWNLYNLLYHIVKWSIFKQFFFIWLYIKKYLFKFIEIFSSFQRREGSQFENTYIHIHACMYESMYLYIYTNGCSAVTFEEVIPFSFFFHWKDFVFPVVPLLMLLPFDYLKFVCFSLSIFVWAINKEKIDSVWRILDMFSSK